MAEGQSVFHATTKRLGNIVGKREQRKKINHFRFNMVEIINKTHPDIMESPTGRTSKKRIFVTIDQERFYFTSDAVKKFGLINGWFLHFIYDEGIFAFIQNEDDDGFQLSSAGRGGECLQVKSRPLCEYFFKKTHYSKTTFSFYMRRTQKEYLGRPMMDIITSRPVNLKKEKTEQ
jgi:uncharacterized protein YbcI